MASRLCADLEFEMLGVYIENTSLESEKRPNTKYQMLILWMSNKMHVLGALCIYKKF